MDVLLAIASKRDRRDYDGRPVSAEETERILDAGRLAGSARNRQPWRFVLVEGESKERLAEAVYEPTNIRRAGLVVGIVSAGSAFDCGRAAQNMMLAAWGLGIASCPNGLANAELGEEILRVGEGESVSIVLSFGYPSKPLDPSSRTVDEWSRRAKRKPLAELVSRV